MRQPCIRYRPTATFRFSLSRLTGVAVSRPTGMLSWGAVAGAVLIAVLLVAPTQAASYSWNQLTGGTWSELANWDTAVDPKDAPNGDAADVSIKQDFGPGATYADLTITLSANTTVNAIRFDDTGSGTDSRLAIGSSGITLTFGGNAPVVESTSSYSGGYGLQINPVVDVGTAGVTKMGWGTVRFNNSITGSGTITVQQGTLELVGSSSGFTGKLVIQNGATLQARTIPGTAPTSSEARARASRSTAPAASSSVTPATRHAPSRLK